MKNKQTSKETDTSDNLAIKRQQRLTAKLDGEFEITGFSITRRHLENMGYDTIKVSDPTMKALAVRLGDIMDWKAEDAIQAADELDIPKHQQTAETSTE
jgi:hypothetical protein